MSEVNAEGIGLAILALAEVPNFFSTLCPDLSTIGCYSEDERNQAVYWLRRGEFHSLALSVALGVGASLVAKNILPLIGCAVVSGFFIYEYEHALKHSYTNSVNSVERDDV